MLRPRPSSLRRSFSEVQLFARALIRAFDSAADPEHFSELEQIRLAPWCAERLYSQRLHLFSEAYQLCHRDDWCVRAKGSDLVEALGTSVAAAMYRGRCAWTGPLDRGQERHPEGLAEWRFKQSFHLIKQR